MVYGCISFVLLQKKLAAYRKKKNQAEAQGNLKTKVKTNRARNCFPEKTEKSVPKPESKVSQK